MASVFFFLQTNIASHVWPTEYKGIKKMD